MTTSVHTEFPGLDKLLADGYVEVGRHYYPPTAEQDAFQRIDLADSATTCLHRMRPWEVARRDGITQTQAGYCLLDKDHHGRHSTVVFWCDVCGHARRGQPTRQDQDIAICFMCTHVEAPV